jgi:spore coat polysaccharide biosynthesis protein SpsF
MILAILQARMGSTRLPGKAMLPILGKPMIKLQMNRIREARLIDRILIATPGTPENHVFREFEYAVPGPTHDVLSRFILAVDYAESFDDVKVSHVVRLTADCPLIDPEVIDQVIREHLSNSYAYTANTRCYPDGLDVEVIDVRALRKADREATSPYDREHVTSYIYDNEKVQFHCKQVSPEEVMRHHRWTVDTREDYEFVKRVYEALYPKNPNFRMKDILAWQESQISLGV